MIIVTRKCPHRLLPSVMRRGQRGRSHFRPFGGTTMGSISREESHEPRESVNADQDQPVGDDRRAQVFRRRRPTILDGPFTESKELLGGAWPPGWARPGRWSAHQAVPHQSSGCLSLREPFEGFVGLSPSHNTAESTTGSSSSPTSRLLPSPLTCVAKIWRCCGGLAGRLAAPVCMAVLT